MTIDVSSSLDQLLDAGTGFSRRYVVDVIYDGQRVLQNQPVSGATFTSDATNQVRSGFNCTFSYSDELGETVIPSDLTSWLAPYGTILDVSLVISNGYLTEQVLIGSFIVSGAGGGTYSTTAFGHRELVIGSQVKLTTLDLFHRTALEPFVVPTSPSQLLSAWQEIANITLLPINRTVADVAIPAATTLDNDRLNAVFALGTLLGGTPFMNRYGQIEVMPITWPAAGPILQTGPLGLAVELEPADLTDDGIFNSYAVTTQDQTSSQTSILATAQVTGGPLRYGGPFGRRVTSADAPLSVVDAPTAAAFAAAQLPGVSTVGAGTWAFQCLPDPRRQVGDVLPFKGRDGVQRTGRIQSLQIPDTGAMSGVLQVQH